MSLKTEVEIAVEAPSLMVLVKWVQIDKNKEAFPTILINSEKVFSSLSNEELLPSQRLRIFPPIAICQLQSRP
jgi:hypothetical protein